MFQRPTFARSPDPGDAGGAAAPADPPAASGAADPTPAGSLLDLADQAAEQAPKDADGKPTRPEWLPEQFWDAAAGAPRVEQMAKSYKEIRAMVSRGEHKPPETPDAYTLPEVEGLPAGAIGGEGDTVWPAVRQAAHAAGITQQQLAAISQPFLAAVAERMREAAPPTPEAERAALEAEMAKLGPNAKAVMRNASGFLKGLEGRGVLSAAEVKALRGVSTAEGVRALAKLAELAGEQPIPVDAIGEDGTTQADAERMLAEGYAKRDTALQDKARRILAGLERQGALRDPRAR